MAWDNMRTGSPREFIPVKISPEGKPIQRILLKGNDHEIGLQRGRELREDIQGKWAWMEPFFDIWYGLPRARWDEVAAKAEINAWKYFPWMAEQVEGMAEGSNLPLRDILLMNYYGVISSAAGNWCSSVAVRQSETGPLLGQNLDIGWGDFYYMEEQQSRSAHPILGDMRLGLCWTPCGINAQGLAVASSFLPTPGQAKRPWDFSGMPYHFIPRLVLRQCGSVVEAVTCLKELPPTIPSGGGYQLNLIDSSGEMAVVDKTGDRTVVRQCEPDLNFTANCTLDEEFELWRQGDQPDLASANLKRDALERVNRIREEWAALQGRPATADWLRKLMASNTGAGALCRTSEVAYSRLSFIFSPSKLTMDIANGPPDRTPYEHVTFAG
jgi:predicted choloylglycine hydrolase